MPDREKVINAIECCVVNRTRCFDSNDKMCPYFTTKVYMCEIELLKDALSLLKEQEAVQPTYQDFDDRDYGSIRLHFCGACDSSISVGHKFCHECGRKIAWSKGRETKKRPVKKDA